MGFDYRQVKQFRDNLEQLDREKDEFLQSCAKDLAARLLALVIRRTPKDTGALKRGWTTQRAGSGAEGLKSNSGRQFAETMKVHHFGDTYVVEIINLVEYASYVEYGHRQRPSRYVPALGVRLKKGWVKGKWMMTVSEKEIQAAAPQILEKKLEKWLRGCLNGK